MTCTVAFLVLSVKAETPPTPAGRPPPLTLSNLVERVLEHNETLQSRAFDYEASWSRYKAERGIFEPEAVGSGAHEVNNRQNNSEQAAAANGISVLREDNRLYEAGLEALVPTGARMRIGYTLGDLFNNVPTAPLFGAPISNHQYQTFFGITATQPLLKNFGVAATMAGIRVAALSSKIAFQQYRRELMTLVSTAEATYWGLYLAQEQVRFFEDSVKTAETILRDNRARLEAGKVSELEVLEAESGLELRRAKLDEARQKVVEAVNRVLLLYAETPSGTAVRVRAVDIPQLDSEAPTLKDLPLRTFELNPDYLAQREKLDQELVRLGFARNQRLPEVNLKGAYGLNGLGLSPYDSWNAIETRDFDSWSIGVELRIPLAGGIKTRNELHAVRAQAESAGLTLRATENEILNGLHTAWSKVQSAQGSVGHFQVSENYNRRLLDSALTRLEEGKIDSRKVLEIEADLFGARNAVVESLVRYKVARLDLELIQGSTLENRHLDISPAELEQTTRTFGKNSKGSGAHFSRIPHDLASDATAPASTGTTNSATMEKPGPPGNPQGPK